MTSLRINHNIASMNSHRNLQANDRKMSRSLENLSSGMKINRGADGPAALVASERMRAQIAGLTQAVMNSETAVSMLQTTEGALNEVNNLLVSMRQLAIHAANEGVNDQAMLEADQAEISNALDSIDRISLTTQFGTKHVLDGSNGVTGGAVGEGLEFLQANQRTKSSSDGGYKIEVTKQAEKSTVVGKLPLTREIIDAGEEMTLIESGRNVTYKTKEGETIGEIQAGFQRAATDAGLQLDIDIDPSGKIVISHRDYGSKPSFEVVSSSSGLLSQEPGIPMTVHNGSDIKGLIDNDVAIGEGRVLSAGRATKASGLEVKYTGTASPTNPEVGRVSVRNSALIFQVGASAHQTTRVSLPNSKSSNLARNMINDSGFTSLQEVDVRTADGAQDSIAIMDRAIQEVSQVRADLGAIQKNTLESNISSLGIARENLVNAESVIRDTDMAAEMSLFTRNQIMQQAATAMLAQSNQSPNNVLSLLN